MAEDRIRVLVVEDDELDRIAFDRFVCKESLPFDCMYAESVEQARDLLTGSNFDVVMLDYVLGNNTALELFDGLDDETAVVIVTGAGNQEIAVQAMKAGAADYIIKDFDGLYLKAVPVTVEKAVASARSRKALREANERLELALSGADLGLWDWTLPTDELIVNERFAQMLGYRVEDIEPTFSAWRKLLHPEDTQRNKAPWKEHLQGKRSNLELEQRLRSSDGRWKWFLTRCKVVRRDAAGNPVRMSGTSLDITDRKKAEEDLRSSEERYRRLVENVPLGVFSLDPHQCFVEANPAFAEILGLESTSQLRGTCFGDHPGLAASGLEEDIRACAESGDSALVERTILSSSGKPVNIRVYITPVRSRRGFLSGLQLLVQDITEHKRAQEILIQSERLKAVGELAGGVAHNFNNLLQVILTGAQLLSLNLDLGEMEEAREQVRQITESCRLGSETVKRLQHFTKLRSEDLDPISRFDVSETVLQAAEISKTWWKINPERKGVHIALEMDLKPECFIYGRESDLFEVLINLIKNASEALPDGGRILLSTCRDEDLVTIEVHDNGVGIAEQEMGRIFEPFFTTKGYQRTGMGLAGSYGLVCQLGGEICADSAPGEGSRFVVRLPSAPHSEPVEESLEGIGPSRRISFLLIDDMQAVVEMLQKGLERRGHTVHTALNGSEGLDLFREHRPDVIVCDLGMPHMNGWEVGKTVRDECERENRDKPLFVLLTGWSCQDREIRKIEESGVDDIIEKPVDPPSLLKVVEKGLGKGSKKN